MNLQLSLKRIWFDMTNPEDKIEDYRDFNEYWFKRLVFNYKHVFRYLTGYEWDYMEGQSRDAYIKKISKDPLKIKMIGFNQYERNIMTLGYPSSGDKDRIKVFQHLGIEIRTGNIEWGAKPNKIYFVIKHGPQLLN